MAHVSRVQRFRRVPAFRAAVVNLLALPFGFGPMLGGEVAGRKGPFELGAKFIVRHITFEPPLLAARAVGNEDVRHPNGAEPMEDSGLAFATLQMQVP